VELGISPSIPPFYSFIIPKITSTRERERSMKDITTPHKESGEGCGKRANGRAFLPIK
jgi:hypothetical protein